MTGQNTPPSRRTAIIATVVVVLLIAGVLLVRLSRDTAPVNDRSATSSGAEAPRPTVAAGAAGPAGNSARVPVGFSADEPGAVAAATAYATASQRWLYFTDEEIEAAIAEIATPVAAPRLTADVVADVAMAREQLAQSSGRIWWLVRPLASRIDDSRDTEARVSVWTVTILSAASVAAPQSEFLTVTLDLSWVDGDWRVDGVRDTPGPTPITGPQDQPWDAEPFDRALDGFIRMDGEPVS
ncbi:hypothetical protein PO878_04395 [Iamia majanohamensis]|uniref:Uncharacterized protein n=1 Tax=Iamia majanohamensis TaxID=467976 RepID=A0AAE9Y7G5_9ACTN|nr:hypothetical protein [Iamia majanohamensis]WCO67962.1 hypothetical protein PO878_04395 [Iamia majanohamensis]